MTTFHPQPSDRGRRVHQKTEASTFQFHVTNCTTKLRGYFQGTRKIVCNNCPESAQERVMEMLLYAKQALPLVRTRIFRFAKISPKVARSTARRPRDGCETSGKKSGVMSCACPRNGRTAATALPPGNCQDDSQDSLPCTGRERVMAASETC